MAITQKTDFTGQYKVSKTNANLIELDVYIAKFEEFYLQRLLGAELFALFIADLTTPTPQVPQTARFLNIFNKFVNDDDDLLRRSEGMKQMLVQFIYFEFVRDSSVFKTSAGVVQNNIEVSTSTPYTGFNLVQAYNEAIQNFKEIQFFIFDNDSVYPEENMQPLDEISGI